MYFSIDSKNKIIFGWSAKCGCSHIKRIYKFIKTNVIQEKRIHDNSDYTQKLPKDMENYTTIIIGRNPYKRLVSGFLEKYKRGGNFRNKWKHKKITFSMFVNELIKTDWKMVDKHHFTPQTTEQFNINAIKKSKCIKCYDLGNIDYAFIEQLCNKTLPTKLLSIAHGHERKKYESDFQEEVFDIEMEHYYNYNVDIKFFYNNELQSKVYNFYKKDFEFFDQYNVEYDKQIV